MLGSAIAKSNHQSTVNNRSVGGNFPLNCIDGSKSPYQSSRQWPGPTIVLTSPSRHHAKCVVERGAKIQLGTLGHGFC